MPGALTARKLPPSLDSLFIYTALILPLRLYVISICGQALTSSYISLSTDDKILVDMGNQREGKTTEEREAYIEGLKDLINNMQRDQVNDFPTVAGEIAAYRRRFLSDPSRILPL